LLLRAEDSYGQKNELSGSIYKSFKESTERLLQQTSDL